MKTVKFFSILAVIILLFSSSLISKEDEYLQMAKEFSEAATSLKEGKIAIVPFNYTDQRKSEGGIIVAERLTTRIVKLKKLKVIERNLLEKVLQELQLSNTGIVDSESAKQIGKILGVEAIITGTLTDIGNNRVEINARMINTESAEIITTSVIEVDKVWDLKEVAKTEPGQQTQYSSQVQQYQTSQQTKSEQKYPESESYFEIFYGNNEGTMDLEFKYWTEKELYFNIDNNPSTNLSFDKIGFKQLNTETITKPAGIKFSFFPDRKYVGMKIEFSYFAVRLAKQYTKEFYLNNVKQTGFNFSVNDYLDVRNFGMGVDLIVRFSRRRLQPYIGIGGGMLMSYAYSPYIYYKSSSDSLSELGIGFFYDIPIGIKFMITKEWSVFLERRKFESISWWSMGSSGYQNFNATLSMTQLLLGVSIKI